MMNSYDRQRKLFMFTINIGKFLSFLHPQYFTAKHQPTAYWLRNIFILKVSTQTTK